MKQQLVLGCWVHRIAQAGEIPPLGERREGGEGQDFPGCTLIPHPDILVRSQGVLALHERPRSESDRGQMRGFGEESGKMQYFAG